MSEKLFITRKRKKYKFAKFNEFENCFQFDEWNTLVNLKTPFSNIILEVGAGTGLFSVELAKKYPNKLFIAIDIKSDRLYTGAKLANELMLKNILFVRSEIGKLLNIIPKKTFSEIWITFPDPYATEDQTSLTSTGNKKRLTSQRFLKNYKNVLKMNGKLNFKTDNKPLFDWSIEQLKNDEWNITQKTIDLHNSDLNEECKIMTTYEKRFIEEGLPIFYLSATMESK